MPKKKESIAIPASVTSDTPHLREKTSKIGLIGRAATIFRVGEIIIYPDNPKVNQLADTKLILMLLSYMETPQYLRKRIFKIAPELQYAGILPPLRSPHHPLNARMSELKVGEYREGVTLSRTDKGMLIDIGVEQPVLMQCSKLALGKRITARITKANERVEAQLASRDDIQEIQEYRGYSVTVEECPFGEIVENRGFDLAVATSRYGVPFGNVAAEMAEKWKAANTVLVAFGAPRQGLQEIVRQEGLNLDDLMDYVINTIPRQGTETVRTEEALVASLAILNVLVL